MISELQIENFKAISFPVTIDFADITLLYGPNSSGKSSVIHALHYLREVLCNERLDPDVANLDGETVYLGGFRNCVYNRDLSRRIRFRLTMPIGDELENVNLNNLFQAHGEFPVVPSIGKILDRLQETTTVDLAPALEIAFAEHVSFAALPLSPDVTNYSLELELAWSPNRQRVYLARTAAYLNEQPLATIETSEDGEARTSFGMGAQRFFPAYDYEFMDWPWAYWLHDPGANRDPEELLGDLKLEGRWAPRETSPQGNAAWREIKTRVRNVPEPRRSWLTTGDKLYQELRERWPTVWLDYVGFGPTGWGTQDFYLEASDPIEFRAEVNPQWAVDEDVYEYESKALNTYLVYHGLLCVIIQQMVTQELSNILHVGPLREHYAPPSRVEPDKCRSWYKGLGGWDTLKSGTVDSEVVSSWLTDSDKFATEYRVAVESKRVISEDQFDQLLAIAETPQEFEELLSSLPAERHIALRNRAGIALSTRDVGTGISQVLPIIVASQLPGGGLRVFEQPELHLHPRMQMPVADVMIAGLQNYGRCQFLVETHSEHLALRVARRIRESAQASTSSTERAICPENVSVVYAWPTSEGLLMRRLRIDDSGEFIDRWPNGFFAERAEELF